MQNFISYAKVTEYLKFYGSNVVEFHFIQEYMVVMWRTDLRMKTSLAGTCTGTP